MILPYLYLFLVFPVLVGILSVDSNGEPFSSLDYIKDRLSQFELKVPEEVKETVVEEEDDFLDNTNSFAYPEAVVLPDEVSDGLKTAWAYIWFLGTQSKDLGTWIGTSSAPFHYPIAFAIAVFALFLNQMMWIIGFFYLLITEWDEFKSIRKKDVI